MPAHGYRLRLDKISPLPKQRRARAPSGTAHAMASAAAAPPGASAVPPEEQGGVSLGADELRCVFGALLTTRDAAKDLGRCVRVCVDAGSGARRGVCGWPPVSTHTQPDRGFRRRARLPRVRRTCCYRR